MTSTRFNPFDKDLKDLLPADLAVLRTISEGWYVEYKQTLIETERLARSIASFANQYGGWLFLGIKQSGDGRDTAGTFVGISCDQIQLARTECRNAVLTKLSPAPYFDLKLLEGPSEELGLPRGRGVLVLSIPQGMDPPYVHSSGVIYRRVADGSDPKPETDRHVLDMLWKRRGDSQKRLARRFHRQPPRSKAEADQTYVHLHLLADPLGDRGIRSRMTFETFTKLMQQPPGNEVNMPFDNVFPATDAYVARQVQGNRPWSLVPTWRYGRDCSSVVTLPLNQAKAYHENALAFLRGYAHASPLIERLRFSDYAPCRILDLNFMCVGLQCAIIQHRVLAADDGVFGPFYFRAFIESTWRRIPFLDLDSYVDWIKVAGVPVVQDSGALAPMGTDYAGMVALPERTDGFLAAATAAIDALLPFVAILRALGVPPEVLINSDGDFLLLVEHAKEVQKLRMAAQRTYES